MVSFFSFFAHLWLPSFVFACMFCLIWSTQWLNLVKFHITQLQASTSMYFSLLLRLPQELLKGSLKSKCFVNIKPSPITDCRYGIICLFLYSGLQYLFSHGSYETVEEYVQRKEAYCNDNHVGKRNRSFSHFKD